MGRKSLKSVFTSAISHPSFHTGPMVLQAYLKRKGLWLEIVRTLLHITTIAIIIWISTVSPLLTRSNILSWVILTRIFKYILWFFNCLFMFSLNGAVSKNDTRNKVMIGTVYPNIPLSSANLY